MLKADNAEWLMIRQQWYIQIDTVINYYGLLYIYLIY